ncbi:ATP-binding protein [Pseudoflavitalea sp. G-6-1-2]|uniref:AAA family ATPase n=1 Tax=Pseudoflavitalea sp. G-6-1-2 TaxID=2728841 RepID=UPI00146CB678|nr:AAA family ATPase [Pseudoflavitalea sp. G-6-1-2]NML23981.1 ATP-binding protein [Pseudoflavitalea sp. G-6-1-2]
MRYKKFIIKGFKGISEDIEFNIAKESIIPIIGKNESGKTTCLEAIFSFDYSNDDENDGKHLKNFENLYSTIETPVAVVAEIYIDDEEKLIGVFQNKLKIYESEFNARFPDTIIDVLSHEVEEENEITNRHFVKAYQLLHGNVIGSKNSVKITRDLRSQKYTIDLLGNLLSKDELNELAIEFVVRLPYILFFDDFRDRIPERVYIVQEEDESRYSKWIKYIEELFIQTNEGYSVYDLPIKSDSIRRSIVKEVEKKLNKILTAEWTKYQFDNSDDIQIKMEYQSLETPYLQFKVVEKILINGSWEERYFDLHDRSKGFYWYFNFMFKLHFNPNKRNRTDIDTIYLLDEPGSYLHSFALNKLAEQLKRLSTNNKVIYCTHFHNLLNPDFIPINSIRIAEKINQGKIALRRLDESQLLRSSKNSPFQPILDALEVKPPVFEYNYDNIILVEGIYDYYSFKMFTSSFFSYFPCVSASSIINQIPYMVFLGKQYLALWDNDDEGRARIQKAKELFGPSEANRFLLLDTISETQVTRLEELFDTNEIANFNTTKMKSKTVSLYKVIIELFFSGNKQELIDHFFPITKNNFAKIEQLLKAQLEKAQILTSSN